jgi:hypothetical protein
MKNEFIPYEQSLELKELGFDEPCVYYVDKQNNNFIYNFQIHPDEFIEWCGVKVISTPTFSQAFRWFREKYEYIPHVFMNSTSGRYSWKIDDRYSYVDYTADIFNTYEESELACVKKLIEIAKNKSN